MQPPRELLDKLPAMLGWVDELLAQHESAARPASSYGFRRLPQYFPAALLSSARVVEVERVPKPPLSRLGIEGFDDMEHGPASGITFKHTYFVQQRLAADEGLHFHELVHVVQWRYLGPERFLTAYAVGHILAGGYRDNPLEAIAYELQGRFESGSGGDTFDAPLATTRHLDRVIPDLLGGPHG